MLYEKSALATALLTSELSDTSRSEYNRPYLPARCLCQDSCVSATYQFTLQSQSGEEQVAPRLTSPLHCQHPELFTDPEDAFWQRPLEKQTGKFR